MRDGGFPGEQPDLMAPGAVARLLGVHPGTVTRWVEEGRLKAIRTPGGHRRIARSELDRFLEGGR